MKPWVILLFFGLGVRLPIASALGKSIAQDKRQGIHRVVVVCLQGPSESNRRIEAAMAPRFQRQGFDARTGGAVFKIASKTSAKGLFETMLKSKMDGVMLINFSGPVLKSGLPKGIRLKYYSLGRFPKKFSEKQLDWEAAMRALLGVLDGN